MRDGARILPRASFAGQFVPAGRFLPVFRLIVIAAVALCLAGTAGAASLVPHTAYYAVSLLSARSGSGMETVSGHIAIRWEGDCGGWTLNHRTVLLVGYSNGGGAKLTMDTSSWEARDASRYSFLVRTLVNGKETDRVEGRATADRAVFTAPEQKVLGLPANTMFPTEHTETVIDAALRGERFLSAQVFDGYTDEGAVLVNAAIGRQGAGAAAAEPAFPPLRGRPAWPIQVAFFGSGAGATPESEVGMRLYDNGVADLIDLDFGDFSIRAELQELKTFPVPDCG